MRKQVSCNWETIACRAASWSHGLGPCVSPNPLEESRIYTKALALLMCLRKAWPKPLFLAAPGMSPGMSARVTDRSGVTLTTPSWGCRVVKA